VKMETQTKIKNKIKRNKFYLGNIVYLITDKEQLPRMITALILRSTGYSYELGCGATSSWNTEIEISSEKTIQL
jgi:hypothetical protein